jgi:hypothetical protein
MGFRRSQQNQFANLLFRFYYPEELREVESPGASEEKRQGPRDPAGRATDRPN